MLPTIYDLRYVEERYRDLRREASAYRLAQANRLARVSGPSPLARIRTLMTRLHLVRPAARPAEAAA
jgi:hypothetical protein